MAATLYGESMSTKILVLTLLLAFSVLSSSCWKPATTPSISIQLNWLHDPTFAGEYFLTKRPEIKVSLKEGGPNIFPISEVENGRADAAIVGADIFLQAVQKDLTAGKESQLSCFFVDFQRNPVGWILHPDAAARAGLTEDIKTDQRALNNWLFSKFSDGTIKPGDKRGTETTAIWVEWKRAHNLSDSVTVVPVGFDTAIVESAPMLAYPVYLNEEPFKLSEKIGRSVIVFDPAADGIHLYGNVLVTRSDYAKANPDIIKTLQLALRESWLQVKNNPVEAAREVSAFYKGVSPAVLQNQIDKTVEFVSYDNATPGTMDHSINGKWFATLAALQRAQLIGTDLTIDVLRHSLIQPQ
jgi:NMT1/THI5 like protein